MSTLWPEAQLLLCRLLQYLLQVVVAYCCVISEFQRYPFCFCKLTSPFLAFKFPSIKLFAFHCFDFLFFALLFLLPVTAHIFCIAVAFNIAEGIFRMLLLFKNVVSCIMVVKLSFETNRNYCQELVLSNLCAN